MFNRNKHFRWFFFTITRYFLDSEKTSKKQTNKQTNAIYVYMQYDCVYIYICMYYSDEREEASKLVEEAEMPLETLLAHYVAADSREHGQ